MIVAQAVAEYGLLDQMALGVQQVSYTVQSFVNDAGPGTWVVVGALAVLGVLALRRRR